MITRRTGGRALTFLGIFAFALIALAPLRLALEAFGLPHRNFAARKVEGSLWTGLVREAQWGGIPVGDVRARLRTLPLLALKVRMDVDSADGSGRIDGALSVTRRSRHIDDLTAHLDHPGFMAPLAISAIDLEDVTIRLSGAGCVSAEGRVRATMRLPIGTGPAVLSGAARCEGGALVLPMRGSDGTALDLRIQPDGRYRAGLRIGTRHPDVTPALLAAGFAPAPNGHQMVVRGRLN